MVVIMALANALIMAMMAMPLVSASLIIVFQVDYGTGKQTRVFLIISCFLAQLMLIEKSKILGTFDSIYFLKKTVQ
jgi:hypothetical protein